MVSVTARKIREHGRELGRCLGRDQVVSESLTNIRGNVSLGNAGPNASGNGTRVYTGFLISYPVVGRGMVIFRDPHGHRMITTPVRRVLGEPGVETLYVETENSVYRLTFHGAPIAPMLNPAGEAAL
jgi:hypothetical protein